MRNFLVVYLIQIVFLFLGVFHQTAMGAVIRYPNEAETETGDNSANLKMSPLQADLQDLTMQKITKINLMNKLKSIKSSGISTNIIKAISADLDLEDQALVLSKNLLNRKVLSDLGLDYLVEKSSEFEFLFGDKLDNITIPLNSKSLFIFNTTDPLSIPNSKDRAEYSEFIDNSPPFNLPTFTNLVDYFLIVPHSYIRSLDKFNAINMKSKYVKSLISVPFFELPFFRKCISDEKPLIVFMFSSGNLKTYENIQNPLLNVKNYLSTNGEKSDINTFFDIFAQNWIKDIDFKMLIHSVFCTINIQSASNSYCLKIEDDNQTLELLPAYIGLESDSKSSYRDDFEENTEQFDLYDSNGENFKAELTKRDISLQKTFSAPIPNAKQDRNEVPNQDLLDSVQMTTLVDFARNLKDEIFPEDFEDRFDEFPEKLHQKLQSLPYDVEEKIDELLYDKPIEIAYEINHIPETIEDTKEDIETNLIPRLKTKLLGGKYLKENLIGVEPKYVLDKSLFENSRLDKREDDNSEDTTTETTEDNNISGEENLKSNSYHSKSLDKKVEEIKAKLKGGKEGIRLPLSLLRASEKPIYSPRKSTYTQVVFANPEDKEDGHFTIFASLTNENSKENGEEGEGDVEAETDALLFDHNKHRTNFYKRSDNESDYEQNYDLGSTDKDCVKITWYNVFHHSIFGKPKFCIGN